MTILGKTIFAVAAVAALVTVGVSLHGSQENPKVATAQLTPEQRAEIFHPPAPAAPKVVPAVHYEAPSPGLTPEDGDGS